jgi:hypothetical protein
MNDTLSFKPNQEGQDGQDGQGGQLFLDLPPELSARNPRKRAQWMTKVVAVNRQNG